MGQMEAISASERARQKLPEAEKSIPQTSEVGPPFCSPSWKLVATASQDERRVRDMPRMESEAKFLYRGVSWGVRDGEMGFNRTFNSWVAPIRLITTRSSVREDLAREGMRRTDSRGGLPSRGAISKELTMIEGGKRTIHGGERRIGRRWSMRKRKTTTTRAW
jgi:hypothetical protein